MAVRLNYFDGANPLHGPLEGVGPENLDFFGLLICSLPFQGPPLPMDLPESKSLRPAPYNNRYINSYFLAIFQ